MEPGALPAAAGSHPEREAVPEPFFDRLVADMGFRWHNAFRRRADGPTAFAADVEHQTRRLTGTAPAQRLPELRYRLRRDGLQPALLAECFGHYCAALAAQGEDPPGPDAVGAALILLQGGIAELAAPAGRRHALGLAATAWAIYGVPVHVVTASEGRTQAVADALRGPLAALGSRVAVVTQGMAVNARRQAYAAPVVCGTQREIAHDYLRERLALGGRVRSLTGMIHRLAGESTSGRVPVLAGLKCALVEDADAVLLDDAVQPLVIAGDAGEPRERLIYEQALELARALSQGAEFTLEGGGTRLTESGMQRIGRLAGPLGGIWAARQQRERLVALALAALHLHRQGVDYRVESGRVMFAEPAGGGAEPADADDALQRLIEVKEGCRLGVRPDVRARLSVPRFYRRYLHLAGACADARGAEGEFWALYGLKTTLAGAPASPVRCVPRVFATVAAKRKALVDRALAISGAGNSLLVAVRTPATANELSGALAAAGVEVNILKGSDGAEDRNLLHQFEGAGAVALALYPAGREPERSAAGGWRLKIIAAELHDARRHLARICRNFAADSYECLLSLEDAGMAARLGAAATRWAQRRAGADGELPERLSHWLAALAQRGAERSAIVARRDMILRDRHLDDLLAFSGRRE